MQETLVIPGVAYLLDKYGFDEPCTHYYDLGTSNPEYVHGISIVDKLRNTDLKKRQFSAPTQELAKKWFLENKRLFICVTYKHSEFDRIKGLNHVCFDIEIYKLDGGDTRKKYRMLELSDDYDHCLGHGLKEAFNELKPLKK